MFSHNKNQSPLFGQPQKKVDPPQMLSADVLKHCLCHYCNCVANVSPVRLVNDQIACGRCLSAGGGIQLLIVEALIKVHNFPCRYEAQGCRAVLQYSLVETHEKSCDFKKVACTTPGCQWAGAKNDIQNHFERCHTQQIINRTVPISIQINEDNTYNLLYIQKNPHLVNITCDRNSIKHSIKSFCTDLEALQISYDIKFSTKTCYVGFNEQKVQSYDSRDETINKAIPVDLLRTMFQDGDKHNGINVNIFIKTNRTEMSCENHAESLNVKDLECPVCHEVMLGQIYVKTCGHNMCSKCTGTMQYSPCPVCRMGTNGTSTMFGHDANGPRVRNYTLEKIIQKIYPTM